MSVIAYVGLGSNLGDRAASCRAAVRALLESPAIRLRAASSLYESEPLGPVLDQPLFLNGVVELETLLDADDLLELLLDVEEALGRERTVPQGPRVIDADLLIYGDLVHDSPRLIVPHPRLTERRFVLVPLLEIAPLLLHPRTGELLAALLERAPAARVVRRPELDLRVWA
ncbi:MAG: 2-amino-4-hydroxy-6-hydroxymethyldihydropteridine diphosphokinase [Deltaproteobacteria bacterium]|nr:2-amino-4-hydroxy-6-hydroxymethyldihydropteridine diphosphokinase [Deltaproteobacteria bacterium]